MNRETVQGTDDTKAAAGVRGAVVVAHGGTEVSNEPVTQFDPAVLRMIPLALAIRHGAARKRDRGIPAALPGAGLERRAGLARARPPRARSTRSARGSEPFRSC